jgi:hypothetical protein
MKDSIPKWYYSEYYCYSYVYSKEDIEWILGYSLEDNK